MAKAPTSDRPTQAAEALTAGLQRMLDNQNASREAFDAADSKFNESAGKMLESFARLAEERPAEVFGLAPTERERFLVREALRPAIRELSSSGLTSDGELEDLGAPIEGSNPAALAGLAGLADVLKSPQGPEILDKIFKHIEAEKKFAKETAGDVITGVGDFIGKGLDWLFGGKD